MVNVALIGVGYWGSKLERYLDENPNFHLKYLCNSKSDLSKVWKDNQVSAVVIATRNDSHCSLTKTALLHNKSVLVEKPLALKVSECEELKRIVIDQNQMLLVEYTWTFSKGLQKARLVVEEGKLGKILGIEMSVRHLGRFGGGSVYWLLGSHMLSVLDMFVPLKTLSFKKTDLVVYKGEVETGVISFSGEVSGQIVISLNYPRKETKVIIYGEQGTIIYEPSFLQVERYKRLPWTVGSKLPRESVEYCFDEGNNLRYAIEYFHQALLRKVGSNVDRAIEVTRVLE